MTTREVEIGRELQHVLKIEEHSSIDNEAGAVVWDCALVMANYFHHAGSWASGEMVAGKRVVELGSGTGLVGLAVALLGPEKVVLTDLPKFMPGLDRNIEENGLGEIVQTAPLLWGEPVDHLEPPADIIIASDVIYAHDTVGALTDTLLSLCGDSTMIILGYELRAGSTGWVQHMAARGLIFKKLPSEELHPHWQADDIGIFIGKREQQQAKLA